MSDDGLRCPYCGHALIWDAPRNTIHCSQQKTKRWVDAEKAEAEVKRLKGQLEQWDAYTAKLGASRDMWKRRAKS